MRNNYSLTSDPYQTTTSRSTRCSPRLCSNPVDLEQTSGSLTRPAAARAVNLLLTTLPTMTRMIFTTKSEAQTNQWKHSLIFVYNTHNQLVRSCIYFLTYLKIVHQSENYVNFVWLCDYLIIKILVSGFLCFFLVIYLTIRTYSFLNF